MFHPVVRAVYRVCVPVLRLRLQHDGRRLPLRPRLPSQQGGNQTKERIDAKHILELIFNPVKNVKPTYLFVELSVPVFSYNPS